MSDADFVPMSAEDFDPEKLRFPLYGSPKMDGIRSAIWKGQAVTKTLKLVPNRFIQSTLSGLSKVIDRFDGELTAGPNWWDASSGIMKHTGEPDFTYHVFDVVDEDKVFQDRLLNLTYRFDKAKLPARIVLLEQKLYLDWESLKEYYETCIEKGLEGVMVRCPEGLYKYGCSTVKEGYLLKMKPFKDSEAIVIGFEEQYHNDNPRVMNAEGFLKRSSKKEGKRPAGTLGKFLVRGLQKGAFKDVEFKIGTGQGLTHKLRAEIWGNRKKYLNKIVKFKYQEAGSKDKPRSPIFLGFRDPRDM